MYKKTHTLKNVTMSFTYDKESKYYLDCDNVIQLDLNFMQKQCYLLWNSLDNKRTKVNVDYDNVLISLSESQFNSIKKSQDQYIDRHNVKTTGSNIFNKLINLKK